MSSPVLDVLLPAMKDPAVLEAAAALASLAPAPEGPVLSATLRLAAAFVRSGLRAEQVNAIVARYSAEAQLVADDWQ